MSGTFQRTCRCIIARIPLVILFLAGCSPEPPPQISDLHFPVVVLYSNTAAMRYDDSASLHGMAVQLLINLKSDPILIDSQLNIYAEDKLQSTHGSLWFIIHPSGNTDVTFDLKRAPASGLDAARAAMRTQLDLQDWRTDLDQRRKTLAIQTTIIGMYDLLRDENQ